MTRPLLLVLDGASLRTPEVESSLGNAGWEVAWLSGEDLPGFLGTGAQPGLVVVDPAGSRDGGYHAVEELRQTQPALPVVLVREPAGESRAGGASFRLPIPNVAGHLERGLPGGRWPSALRPHLEPRGRERAKLTTEDLFGDILADLAAPVPAPAPPLEPPPPPPVPVQAPLEVVGIPVRTPAPLGASARESFTLSGISGIKDPFAPEVKAPVPAVDKAQGAARQAEEPFQIEFLGTAGGPAEPLPLPPPPPALPPPPPEPAPGSLEEFGNYYLLDKIAVGGMAELFKARQRGVHNFEKIVAIKRILPHLSDNDEFVRMFIDEAKLAAQLTHPNIVQIFDLGKAGGFYYIAMEYVDGRDLRSLLRKVREYHLPFPEAVAAFVTMKVAGALDYAHRKKGMNDKDLKLVHRDISPQNILISGEGAVKLVDFGIAKAATKSTQTMAGALKGKLLYMSPEQALGQNLDSRSDIYSLGLVLYELLTGERCFQADSELGVLEKVRLGKVADIHATNPAVSREMVAIVEKALQKDVDRRYASARQLERDLKALLVRQGSEPAEHDVAEFVHTLLKGTREQLDQLVAERFPAVVPKGPRSVSPLPLLAAPPMPAHLGDAPTAHHGHLAPAAPPAPEPPGFLDVPEKRPAWLLPALGILVASVGVALWLALR